MTAAVTITDVPDRSRFEARVDGELAGYAAYVRSGDVVDHTHTVVSEDRRGEGIGGELVRAALEDARRRGVKVRPSCSFVRTWLARHPDYQDLVAD